MAASDSNFPMSKILITKNIREDGWEKRVDSMAASIKEGGLWSPILISPLTKPADGKTHELIYGHRRFAAYKQLKHTTIKVIFAPKGMTRKQKDTARLVENTEREDLSPVEEAKAYKEMMESHSMTAKQVAKTVGKTDGHVSQRLALLRMPPKVLEAVESGGISATHARQLHRFKDADKQEKFVEKAASMTAQSFESFVDNKLNPGKKAKKGKAEKDKPTDKYQPRESAMKALTKLDKAAAQAMETANKEKTAHLKGVIRGISWTLKVKNAKLPV